MVRIFLTGYMGAGKTTLVRLLKGLLKPVSGSIYFGEEDISQKTVAMLAGKVGYVFQNPDDQIFKYNVLDEVMVGPLNIGMNPETAKEKALKAFTETVSAQLKKGDKIQLVGFGTFEVSKRAAREGRNPQTGAVMKIAASKAPKFKAGKALKDLVNKR